jgi:hypothetical protein
MEIVAQNGVFHRTKLLTLAAAAAFARCLGGNSRFTSVSIEESKRAKSEKRWMVLFQPSNASRQEAMVDRQQDARARRACEQPFTFCLDKDAGRPFFWCHSHTSGEVYEVGANAECCSCPDATYRLRGTGLRCKHQLALLNTDSAELRTW